MSTSGGAGTLIRRAGTGVAGFDLQDATPTILTWTAPADGELHAVKIVLWLDVTVAETGGEIGLAFSNPGAFATITLLNASKPVGQYPVFDSNIPCPVMQPSQIITVEQVTAMTAGTAKLFAEIWAS